MSNGHVWFATKLKPFIIAQDFPCYPWYFLFMSILCSSQWVKIVVFGYLQIISKVRYFPETYPLLVPKVPKVPKDENVTAFISFAKLIAIFNPFFSLFMLAISCSFYYYYVVFFTHTIPKTHIFSINPNGNIFGKN